MKELLFLSHRIPYPPDKGEKIRALNLLKHLSRTYRIRLGCLVDTPEDAAHVDTLREWCAEVAAFPIDKRRQKVVALARIRPGRPLMLDYYRHPGLQRWVDGALAATRFDRIYIYSVAMRPYVQALRQPGIVLDAIDIDSEKWTTYAKTAKIPMRYVWAREGRTLLAYERQSAMACDATFFVSPQEADRFVHLAPETRGRVHAVEGGVDLDIFDPTLPCNSPFTTPGPHIVFTGNMDYWPNADAVTWFATAVMPALQAARPGLTFHIVGANPGPAVTGLARPGIAVTGRVPDIRPWLIHADLCVAPLRIARGVQTKVLEAMAMARPVIASPEAHEGISALPGRDLLVADGAEQMEAAVLSVLDGAHPGLAAAGRRAIETNYSWSATLARLDAILATLPHPQ